MLLVSKIKIPSDLQKKLNLLDLTDKKFFSDRKDIYCEKISNTQKSPANRKNKSCNTKKEADQLSCKDDIDKIALDLKTKPLNKTFHELLFEFIDNSGLTEPEIYFRASIDRRLFSKIRSDINYHPSFGTVTLLAIALKLSTKDYEKLLDSVSYSLSSSSYVGITLRYCFDKKIYDVVYVNNLVYTVTGKDIRSLI